MTSGFERYTPASDSYYECPRCGCMVNSGYISQPNAIHEEWHARNSALQSGEES